MRHNIKHQLVEYCQRMYANGFVAGKEGNLSVRTVDDTVWMTPSGVNKGDVTEDMLVRLDLNGNLVEGNYQPTSERSMHLEAYRQRADVNAVVHGHPIYCTAFAAAQVRLPSDILPELVATVGEIPLVPYGTPSSPGLAEAVAPYFRSHNCFLLENHGALVVGENIADAYYFMEVLESYARIVWVAYPLGGVKKLSATALDQLPRPTFDAKPNV